MIIFWKSFLLCCIDRKSFFNNSFLHCVINWSSEIIAPLIDQYPKNEKKLDKIKKILAIVICIIIWVEDTLTSLSGAHISTQNNDGKTVFATFNKFVESSIIDPILRKRWLSGGLDNKLTKYTISTVKSLSKGFFVLNAIIFQKVYQNK